MNVSAAPLLILLAATSAASSSAAAQPAAASAETSERGAQVRRFDLERNFFPSLEAEIAARPDVLMLAEEVTKRAATLETPGDLLAAFDAADRMQRVFRQHDLYLFLRYAVDIRREDGMAAADALRTKVRAANQALRRAVTARDAAWIARAMTAQPALARYRFSIETMRRDAVHTLAPDKQAVVSALEPTLGAGDYPRIVNALQLGSVEVAGRRLDVRRDRSAIEGHALPEVRREGARKLFAGYAAQRDLLAYMLVRTIDGGNALARLKGHSSLLAEAAFDAYVTPASYEGMLAEIARSASFYKRWQKSVGDPFVSPRRWSLDAASAAVVASSAPLGDDYQREFAQLLDPANGRADLTGGDNRLPAMGTASVYPTGKSAIYMNAFGGSLLDLIVLAHEGGHAIQAQLMYRRKVPMAYAAGPGYFTESFGRFQELLLLDHLHRSARDGADRALARDALAARLLAVFPSGEEAAVELAIHQAVGAGKARTADELDAATAASGEPYSIDYQRYPERRGLWMLSEGYYMAPLHQLGNAYSSLLSVRYFQLYRRNPAAFRTAYLALLANGFDSEPRDLLRRHLGIDMMGADFTGQTLAVLEAEIDALYR